MGGVHSSLTDLVSSISTLFTAKPKSYNPTMTVIRQHRTPPPVSSTTSRHRDPSRPLPQQYSSLITDVPTSTPLTYRQADDNASLYSCALPPYTPVAPPNSTPPSYPPPPPPPSSSSALLADSEYDSDPLSPGNLTPTSEDEINFPPPPLDPPTSSTSRPGAPHLSPTLWPTAAQVRSTLTARQYDPSLLHFAICGPAGSGKSALINALRGLSPFAPTAAATGVVETTATITRYPDPRTEMPYARFVWYDVPGAGTRKVPSEQYFVDMGLYVFDFIVLVWGERWGEIDAGIVEAAGRFDVPLFVVRSRSDMHIENLVKMELARAEEEEDSDDDDEESDDEGLYDTLDDIRTSGPLGLPGAEPPAAMYERCKTSYISTTRTSFAENITPSLPTGSPVPKLYLISAHPLRYLTSPQTGKKKYRRAIQASMERLMIDEEELVKDMISAAVERRYPKSFRWLEQGVGVVASVGRGVVEGVQAVGEGARRVIRVGTGMGALQGLGEEGAAGEQRPGLERGRTVSAGQVARGLRARLSGDWSSGFIGGSGSTEHGAGVSEASREEGLRRGRTVSGTHGGV